MMQSKAVQERALQPLQPVTLVARVVDAIVRGAAEGIFLPGERVVEAEVARRLEVSRVPVREALRLLESQGVVTNEPYRGMRLMDIGPDRVAKTLSVRLALEQLAIRDLRARGNHLALEGPLMRKVAAMAAAEREGDGYGIAMLDTEFHRLVVEGSGNEVLVRAWEPLARQMIIMIGLSTRQKPLSSITEEHREFTEALLNAPDEQLFALLERHVYAYLNEMRRGAA